MKKTWAAIGTVIGLGVAVFLLNRQIPPVTVQGGNTSTASVPGAQGNSPSLTDIVLKDLDGKEVKIADFNGKVVLIDFWATWCGPCKLEIPMLIELQKKYASRGLVILGVDIDEEGNDVVRKFMQTERFDVNGQKEAFNYPILVAPHSLGDKFGVDGYPTSVLISRDGHLAKITPGLVGLDELEKDVLSQF